MVRAPAVPAASRAHEVSSNQCALPHTPADGARRGWRAHLQLGFERRDGASRLTQRRHEGPLLVQRAFYPEASRSHDGADGPCHVYVIHPPGGVVGGDQLSLDLSVAPQAHALLTTPAAGKFYRRGSGGTARLEQQLAVRGRLEWLPQENIFYPDCAVKLRTRVQLEGEGRFVGWEVGCLGLPAIGLDLGAGQVSLAFELWREGRPLLLERQHLCAPCLAAPWGLRGHAAFGSCLAYPVRAAALTLLRAQAEQLSGEDLTVSCTLVDEVLCCRGFACRADRLRAAFAQLWGTLRPVLLGREAVPPRIWAT